MEMQSPIIAANWDISKIKSEKQPLTKKLGEK